MVHDEQFSKTPDFDIRQLLKNMSTEEFLSLGLRDVAYIKPLATDSEPAFAIHAADGTQLTVMDSIDSAMIMVRHNDLQAVTVH